MKPRGGDESEFQAMRCCRITIHNDSGDFTQNKRCKKY